jgi:hypothetical protein
MWKAAKDLLGIGGKVDPEDGVVSQEDASNDPSGHIGGLDEQTLSDLPPALSGAIHAPETKAVFHQPERQTNLTKFWEFGGKEGMELAAGEQIIIVVPDGAEINLEDVFLGHRKDKKYWGDTSGEWDAQGAYTEVQVFDGNTNQWRGWKDPMGHNPVKYAERRHSIEYEKLGQWYGMVGDIAPLAFRLIGRGKGELGITTEHDFEMFSHPEFGADTETIESIYSPGTTFTNYGEGTTGPNRKPRYGGGKQHYTKGPQQVSGGPAGYPGAIALRGRVGVEPFQTTDSLSNDKEELDDQGRLWINLPPGVKLKALEISAGARWWTTPIPDPSLASKGGRKISATIINSAGSEVDKFMNRLNVGPAGVLIGGPSAEEYITKPGDRILIEGEEHTSYLMGWRVVYDKLEGATAKSAAAVSHGTETSVSQTMDLTSPPLQLVDDPGESPGGTQGAKWQVDQLTGDRYISKEYNGNQDRCATEFIANRIYQAMGIAAPTSYMHKERVVSKEIKGLEKFNYQHSAGKAANMVKAQSFYDGHSSITSGFVVDAWLANWDVFGLDYDNVLKKSDGDFARVDAGGALFYRGMGQKKPQFGSEAVTEINTMRDPSMAREAGAIFQNNVTENDIEEQVAKLVEVMTDSRIKMIVEASEISNTAEVIATLIKRREWLKKQYYKAPPKVAPASEQVSPEAPAEDDLVLVSTGKKVGHHGEMHRCESTGEWKGRHFVVKEYDGNADRAATEYIANKIYERMGIPVIDSRLQGGKFISKTEAGLKSVGSNVGAYNHQDIRNGFVVDAWLANWDVIGTSMDNVRSRPSGQMLRTNNNGSLFYRFMGDIKPGFASPAVTEMDTMRNSSMSPAGKVFNSLNIGDGEIKIQVKKLQSIMTDAAIAEIVDESGVSNAEDIKKALMDRRDWLVDRYNS